MIASKLYYSKSLGSYLVLSCIKPGIFNIDFYGKNGWLEFSFLFEFMTEAYYDFWNFHEFCEFK